MLKMMFSKLFRLHFIFEVTRCGFKKIIQIIISNSLFCTELIDIAIFKNFYVDERRRAATIIDLEKEMEKLISLKVPFGHVFKIGGGGG